MDASCNRTEVVCLEVPRPLSAIRLRMISSIYRRITAEHSTHRVPCIMVKSLHHRAMHKDTQTQESSTRERCTTETREIHATLESRYTLYTHHTIPTIHIIYSLYYLPSPLSTYSMCHLRCTMRESAISVLCR